MVQLPKRIGKKIAVFEELETCKPRTRNGRGMLRDLVRLAYVQGMLDQLKLQKMGHKLRDPDNPDKSGRDAEKRK